MRRMMPIAAIALLILAALALVSCVDSGETDLSDSKYVGTWKATTMALADESEELDGEWILILNEDGTGQFVDEEGTSEITWQPTDDGFKTKGDVKLTFKDDGDNIKAKILGVDLIFERQ